MKWTVGDVRKTVKYPGDCVAYGFEVTNSGGTYRFLFENEEKAHSARDATEEALAFEPLIQEGTLDPVPEGGI